MTLPFESFLAFRYLRSKRKEVFISIITIISVLGVAVSVMVLDITLGIMTGFEKELQAKLLDTSAHIIVRGLGGEMPQWQQVREKVLGVPGVVDASPYTYNQAMLTFGGVAHGLLIRGISDDARTREKLLRTLSPDAKVEDLFAPVHYQLQRPDGTQDEVLLPPLVVGRALARRFGLSRGTAVTILSPQMSASPQGLTPRMRRFVVIGNYSSGLIEFENGLAYTSVEAAQSFFNLGDAVSGLEVTVTDLNEAKAIADKISVALDAANNPYDISDWTVPNKPLWDALRLEKRVYFIVLLLLILVASFSIVSTLVMVVMEKSRDIALLKSIGARDRSIMRVFLLQGAYIGFSGTLLGTLLGYAGAIGLREFGFRLDEAVFSLSKVPVELVPANFLLVGVAAFVITVLAGIYPARRAAKMRPADALRFE